MGAELAPARFAGTVSGQQANAARKSRAWCTLEARGELLAASFCGQTGDTGIDPTSAAQLLAATSAQPPPCAHCRAQEPPCSLDFKPLFRFSKGALNPQPVLEQSRTIDDWSGGCVKLLFATKHPKSQICIRTDTQLGGSRTESRNLEQTQHNRDTRQKPIMCAKRPLYRDTTG